MNYLIDTCVVSELVKKTPDIQVVQWFNQQQPTHLFISSVSIAEIKKGLYKIQLAQPERFEKLQKWLNTLETQFRHRVLPVTDAVLENWAEISAKAELQGRKLAVMDSPAYRHQLALATRNVDDFKDIPVQIFNPFQ
ncbi:MAG: type II toxin-antitoxin system VapC family toxin [Gallionella sp.]|nr:type II toxin-antitoxin system VapC family toxin [Gallionella sp.]